MQGQQSHIRKYAWSSLFSLLTWQFQEVVYLNQKWFAIKYWRRKEPVSITNILYIVGTCKKYLYIIFCLCVKRTTVNMFILYLQKNSQRTIMTICMFYLTFVFGINCDTFHRIESVSTQSYSTATPSYQYHSSGCKVTFYNETNHQGEKIEVSNPEGMSTLELNEQSAQTFGRCCWKIYS